MTGRSAGESGPSELIWWVRLVGCATRGEVTGAAGLTGKRTPVMLPRPGSSCPGASRRGLGLGGVVEDGSITIGVVEERGAPVGVGEDGGVTVGLTEEGSATVGVAGVLALLLALALAFTGAATVLAERAWLQGVADLAALAAADAAPPSQWLVAGDTGDFSSVGCGAAVRVTTGNGATLSQCWAGTGEAAGDFFAVVSSRATVFGLPLVIKAKARAGPAISLESLHGD